MVIANRRYNDPLAEATLAWDPSNKVAQAQKGQLFGALWAYCGRTDYSWN